MKERFWPETTATPASDPAPDAATHPHKRLRALMFLALVAFGLVPAAAVWVAGTAAEREAHAARGRDALQAMVGNRAATVDMFLAQRMRHLELVAASLPVADLRRRDVLERLRAEMDRDGGAIVDLGLIGASGRHLAYAGPYELMANDYRGQPWFERVLVQGRYQSDLFLGFRRFPHIVLAVRKREDAADYLLRATIDTAHLAALLREGGRESNADVAVLNRGGEYQASCSPGHRLMEKAEFVPPEHAGVRVTERVGPEGPELVASQWLAGGQWVVVAHQARLGAWAVEGRSPLALALALSLAGVPLLAVLIARYGYRRVRALEEERAALYQSVARSEKLAAIGRLATNTAHEINNPLAIIDAQVGLLNDMLHEHREVPIEAELKERLRKISAQVQRGKNVTHQLLGFSRKVGPLVEAVDVVAVLEESLSCVEKDAEAAGVRLTRDCQRGIPLVRSNAAQMQQVFVNVLANAIDAVDHQGEVRVAVRCGRGGVEVAVGDSGPGIPEADLERVFEPFYSTKPRDSRHCGLGLAICRETMRTLGGRITASSAPGEGATFTMWFPLQDEIR